MKNKISLFACIAAVITLLAPPVAYAQRAGQDYYLYNITGFGSPGTNVVNTAATSNYTAIAGTSVSVDECDKVGITFTCASVTNNITGYVVARLAVNGETVPSLAVPVLLQGNGTNSIGYLNWDAGGAKTLGLHSIVNATNGAVTNLSVVVRPKSPKRVVGK